MSAQMEYAWISRKCLGRCKQMTLHRIEIGESKKARWTEYTCFECGRRFNATSRKSWEERQLELVA